MHWNHKNLSSKALNNATTFQYGRGSDDKRGITVKSEIIRRHRRQRLKLAIRYVFENRRSESALSLVVSRLKGSLQSHDCGDGGVRTVHGALYHRRELRNEHAMVGEDLRLHMRLRIRVVLVVVRLFFGIVLAFRMVVLRIGIFFVFLLLLLVLGVAPSDLRISLALPPSGSVLCQKKTQMETKLRTAVRELSTEEKIAGIGNARLALGVWGF